MDLYSVQNSCQILSEQNFCFQSCSYISEEKKCVVSEWLLGRKLIHKTLAALGDKIKTEKEKMKNDKSTRFS